MLVHNRPRRRTIAVGAVAVTAAMAAALLGSAPASAATRSLVLLPTDDTFVSSATPTRAYGAADAIVATSAPTDRKVSYLKYAVAGLPSGATNVHATLTLNRTLHHLPSSTVKLLRVPTNAWSESSLTARTAPAPGVLVGQKAVGSQTSDVVLDVTSAVHANGVFSFAVTDSATTDIARFNSAEATTGSKPKLTITYTVPAPSPSPSATRSQSPSPSPTRSASPSPSVTPSPTHSPSPSPTAPGCTVSALLVPSCGAWWGAAPGAHTSTPLPTALADYERNTQTPVDLLHVYHKGSDHFPNAGEIALSVQSGHKRLILANWKPSGTWAQVANGYSDRQIDSEAAYIKTTFPWKFFLAVYHEPENDVNTNPGSGMTATDYHNMYRHVVQRLRADGVTNAVFVVNYMSFQNWCTQPWFETLYPGDDVVDWIAFDPYAAADSNWMGGGFDRLMNRTADVNTWEGFYHWAQRKHPSKPLMLGEWGVFETTSGNWNYKPAFFDDVAAHVADYPALKALTYFDTPSGSHGDSRVTSSAGSLARFRVLAANPYFHRVSVPTYN